MAEYYNAGGEKTMRLETERLILRDYAESDREDYYRLKFAFTEDGVYRVTTGCLAENAGSEKV